MLANILREDGSMTVFVKGKPYQVDADHEEYETIVQMIKDGAEEGFVRLVDKKIAIEETMSNIKFDDDSGQPTYNGRKIDNSLAKRLIRMANDREDLTPFENFLDNLFSNPSRRAIDETYRFMQANDLPMTNDGHLLAYKAVRNNFMDKYTGKIDNSPGKVVTMDRSEVMDDPNQTCAEGLHFCSIAYLRDFYWSGGDKLVAVKVNPANIVSIPVDYDNSKVRCCEYLVLEELDNSIIDGEEEWDADNCPDEINPTPQTLEDEADAAGELDEDDWDDIDVDMEDDEDSGKAPIQVEDLTSDYLPATVIAKNDLLGLDVDAGTKGEAVQVAGTGSIKVRWEGKNLYYWIRPEDLELA